MKEMILFWHEGDHRLDENNGNVVKTFLQQLAREIVIIQVEFGNYNVKAIAEEIASREGWCYMDGSSGIRLYYAEDVEFEHGDFDVEEIL